MEQEQSLNEKVSKIEEEMQEKNVIPKYREITGKLQIIPLVMSTLFILLSINWAFDLRLCLNIIMQPYTFYYLVAGLCAPLAFLYIPMTKKAARDETQDRIFWIDLVLAMLILAANLYLAYNAYNIYTYGWERIAPPLATAISVFLWIIYVDMARRSAGWVLTVIIALFSALPIYTQYLPGILNGLHKDFLLTAQMHILGTDSGMGTLMRTFCEIVLPYTIFGTVIVACGGGEFFLNVAMRFFGRFRGGMAKVAVVSSALFGSISGNPVVNVMTTGSVTIPAMKKSGFEPNMAGAVEACASTAGTMTPPIMGTASFVMASMLGISYTEVATAAIFPILTYYLCVLFAVDFYAAKKGLHGLSKEEIPKMRDTVKTGWFFVPTIAILIFYIFVLRQVPKAALWASLCAFVLTQLNKNSRLSWRQIADMILGIGKNCMEVIGVMMGVGFIMGSFSMTGLGVSFPHEVYVLAGGNVILLVFLTAFASLLMGMGMTTICCYIFLAVTIAPALTEAGLDLMSVHMFLLYCGMLSYITPPVAVATIPAAMLSGGDAMKIGLNACRLGATLFVVPFLFVANPSLLLRGDSVMFTVKSMLIVVLAVFVMTQALENYILGIGPVQMKRVPNLILRTALVLTCMIFGLPSIASDIIGGAILLAVCIPLVIHQRRLKQKMAPTL